MSFYFIQWMYVKKSYFQKTDAKFYMKNKDKDTLEQHLNDVSRASVFLYCNIEVLQL